MKDIVELEIHNYTKKGLAEATVNQGQKKVSVHVKGASIGETIEANIFTKRRKVYLAELKQILKSSPFRIQEKCQHALICGGCSWQHLDYKHQINQKQKSIVSLFSDVFNPLDVSPIIEASQTFHYRNKMEFTFSQDKLGHKYLGLIKSCSKGKVINLQECFLVNTWQIDLLKRLRLFFEESHLRAYHPYKDEGTFQTLILREGLHTEQKLVMLTVSGNPHFGMRQSDIEKFKEAVLEVVQEASIYLRIKQAVKGHKTQFFEMHLHGKERIEERLHIDYLGKIRKLKFFISPSSFFQPNTFQAEKLFSIALKLVGKKVFNHIVDLYCGTGSLSLIFSHVAKRVTAIELNPYSIFDAKENAKANRTSNVDFIQGDATDVLKNLKQDKLLENIDLVVLDPPRAGMDDRGLKEIALLNPSHILYISCHPHSQKEDISYFIQHGYHIQAIQPVDQFPHTPHIENIVLLHRN